MKLQQKIFGIGLLTAVSVPHLYEKGYRVGGRMDESPNIHRLKNGGKSFVVLT
jgi:hypothetical protein